jgi:branched-chain amino acid transport system ATP-binding protein
VLLEAKGLRKEFGGLIAINDLSFYVEEGEIVGLIGPNGSGKTTVFNVICGRHRLSGGQVIFKGIDTTGFKAHTMAKNGMVRTFQTASLLRQMTLYENVMLACHLVAKPRLLHALLGTYHFKEKEKMSEERAIQMLELVGLDSLKDEVMENIPYGHQRSLGIAMALAADPVLLLLDEPVAGMNVEETTNTVKLIRRIRDGGVTILVIEHDMRMIMGVCDRLIAINCGQKIAEGRPDEIRSNEAVIEAYLGRSYAS